ncbi:MBL fold metallo-hydrolase [Salinigranum halophilum]|uniref:MBL fold metallo-hydrolase n=1 Tax=Salinigranum halophilum TaxID=2565931 RepID=UPI0010A9008E|nr:MBL fold metallo-hydrolase [Salinigranum halophilum]
MIHNIARDVDAFTSNAFLVSPAARGDHGADGRTVLVDTGANFDAVSHLQGDVDHLDAVVITHTHPDHVGNVDAIRDRFDVETWGFDASHPAVDNRIDDGDVVRIGTDAFRALHTPGHAVDHLCLYDPDSGVLFAGDLVFAGGSFGRTDLPGGDGRTLVESIERVVEAVDETLQVLHTGHGPSVLDDPFGALEQSLQAARARA